MRTPWGYAQHVSELAEGILIVMTSSHGGICLSPERQQQMPMFKRKTWYEEDCEAWHVLQNFWDEVQEGMKREGWTITKERVDQLVEQWPLG